MFSLMNLLILQPLPYPDRDQLVRIYRTTPQSQTADHTASDYLQLRRETEAFADAAAYRMWGYTLSLPGRTPTNLNALRVSANFLAAVGVRPELGRFFADDEDVAENHVIILAHDAWEAQFGGDPSVIGRTVQVDGQATVVIGVMPEAFGSIYLWGPCDALRPLGLSNYEKLDQEGYDYRVLARMKPGIDVNQFNSRLAALAQRFAPQRPAAHRDDGLHAVSLQETARGTTSRPLSFFLLGLAGFVLVIACANLANLQLARAIARTHEFAIRAALGASRSRLLRPLLAESVLLALGGGLLGILVALWTNDWISSRLSANGFVTFTLQINWLVLGFALVLSSITGFAFGLVPAWLVSRVRVNETLKTGGRGSTGDRVQHRLRHSLIIGQFALALVLLVGAGAFTRGFARFLEQKIGWDQHSVLQTIVNLPASRYSSPAQTYDFYRKVEERIGGLPGVEHVAVAWTLPMYLYLVNRNFIVEGRPPPAPGHETMINLNAVTPGYLDTLHTHLQAGRNFTEADRAGSPPVAIINESLARALFPNESPLGHRLGSADPKNPHWMEIVGVIPDQRMAVNVVPQATAYTLLIPLAQETWNYATIAVSSPHPDTVATAVRSTLAELDPNLALQQFGTVDELVRKALGGFTMINLILGAFALLGLFLSTLGLYGVIARLVAQRTQEIGVRIALGAQSRDVVWLIVRTGLRLTLIGAAFGLVGSVLMLFGLGSALPNFPMRDPWVVAGVTVLLVGVAIAATWLPAARAARINPITALRAE